jgi:hypothetical protein
MRDLPGRCDEHMHACTPAPHPARAAPPERSGRPCRSAVSRMAEIPLDGVAPAVANAVYAATGVQVPVIPLTPERVWRAMKGRA